MKLNERLSWLITRVQRTLFSHLEECLVSPLTEQEKHLVMILELVQIEKLSLIHI